MLQESGVIQRIMRKWQDKRDNNYDMAEARSLGFETLLFPFNLLARIHQSNLSDTKPHKFQGVTKNQISVLKFFQVCLRFLDTTPDTSLFLELD